MEKERKSQLIQMILYSLAGLLVGGVVGGTLLLKMTTQDNAPVSLDTALSSLSEETDAPEETQEEAEIPDAVSETEELQEQIEMIVTEPPLDAVAVCTMMEAADELLSMTYYYTDSECYENYTEVFGRKVPFTTDSVVLTFDGSVCMGIDPTVIAYSVDPDAKVITVTLPQPEILSHELDEDSIEYFDVKNSIFVESSLWDYTHLLSDMKDEICRKVIAERRFDQLVTANAETVIRNFLSVSEKTAEYAVQFASTEPSTVSYLPFADADDSTDAGESDDLYDGYDSYDGDTDRYDGDSWDYGDDAPEDVPFTWFRW